MTDNLAEEKLAGFLAKFNPDIAAAAATAIAKLRARLPGAVMLVYDNYNALAIAFGSSERLSDVILSVAVYPRWVSLFLTHGPRLNDPSGRLKGSGNKLRHIVLESTHVLDEPAVKDLIAQAVTLASRPLDANAPHRVVIKSISAKQRPRRPG